MGLILLIAMSIAYQYGRQHDHLIENHLFKKPTAGWYENWTWMFLSLTFILPLGLLGLNEMRTIKEKYKIMIAMVSISVWMWIIIKLLNKLT